MPKISVILSQLFYLYHPGLVVAEIHSISVLLLLMDSDCVVFKQALQSLQR